MYKLFDLTLLAYGSYLISLCSLIQCVFIYIAARFFIFAINKILKLFLQSKNLDYSRSYTIDAILKYIICTLTCILAHKSLGAQLSLPLLGSAVLLVGIGLCLRHTFSDFLNGLILWVKGHIEVGAVMNIEGIIGQITRIGLCTCSIKTKKDFTLNNPNSKLLKQSINWNDNNALLSIEKYFGISYKSDINLGEKMVTERKNKYADVVLNPASSFQLINFGESLLNFGMMFYSDNLFWVEKVKSNIRKNLFKELRIKGVEISCLQRDIWVK